MVVLSKFKILGKKTIKIVLHLCFSKFSKKNTENYHD